MPESPLLIGLETSFKSSEWQYLFDIESVHLVLAAPSLAYGLYTCEMLTIMDSP